MGSLYRAAKLCYPKQRITPHFTHRNSFSLFSWGSCLLGYDCRQQTAVACWYLLETGATTVLSEHSGVQGLRFTRPQGPPKISSLNPTWIETGGGVWELRTTWMLVWVGDRVLFRKCYPGCYSQGNLTSPSWERPTKYFLTLAGTWFNKMF